MSEANLTTPTVSVIIPTRNRAHVLKRAIDSVLAQTVDNLEVIVVDDASVDETEDLVKSIDDSRVRYVKFDQHRGAPAARNTGMRLSRGNFFAFHDSDDEWLPTKLERQLELIQRRAPLADVATCGTVRISRDGRTLTAIAANETLSYQGLLAFTEPPWSGPTLLVRRTAATHGVLFDETLPAGQDWDYLVRLAKVTQVVSVREPLVKIGQATGDRISKHSRKLEARKLLRKKHDSELRGCRPALAAHEVGIGALSVSCGEYTEARRRFATALRISPFQPRVVALLLRTFLSQSQVMRTMLRRRPRSVDNG